MARRDRDIDLGDEDSGDRSHDDDEYAGLAPMDQPDEHMLIRKNLKFNAST